MTTLPKPDLATALAELSHRDEFKVVLGYIREERERMLADLGPCVEPFEVMKHAGGIARLDELLQVLTI